MMKAHNYLLFGMLAFTGGCVAHIAPYESKKREFDRGDYANSAPQGANSLYAQGARGLLERETIGKVVARPSLELLYDRIGMSKMIAHRIGRLCWSRIDDQVACRQCGKRRARLADQP